MADAALAQAAPRRGLLRRRPPASFVLALVVLAGALGVGSGVTSSRPPTAAQRAAAVEAQVRCPSCEDVSVAQSSASSAIAVRHEIARLVAQGEPDARIESQLVAQYGESILLAPPDSGLSSLVWLLPALAGTAAIVGLGTLFWRRTRSWRRLGGEAR